MMSFIRNLAVLTFKEIKSVMSDVIMMIFMIYLCTVAVVMAAQNITTEVRNASVAITDHDALLQEAGAHIGQRNAGRHGPRRVHLRHRHPA